MIDEAREALYCLKRVAGSHAITQDQIGKAALRLEQALVDKSLRDDAAQQAAGEQALPPLPNGWVFNHAQQHRDEDGPVDGMWEIGFLDAEDDRFSPIVTVDTGLYYQGKDAEPLAQAILARLVEARAAQAAQPLPESATRTTLVRDERPACEACGIESTHFTVDGYFCDDCGPGTEDKHVRNALSAPAEALRTLFRNHAPTLTCAQWEEAAKTVCAAISQPAPEAAKGSESVAQQYAREELARQMEPVYAAFAATTPAPEAQQADTNEPLFWYRPCSDGTYEGPLHNARIEEVRKKSGAWVPLFSVAKPEPQQPAQAVPLSEAQAERLYANIPPSAQQDARSREAFKRIVKVVEEAHGIGVKLAGGGEGV